VDEAQRELGWSVEGGVGHEIGWPWRTAWVMR
jgi:hypothetical protein